MKPIEKTLAAMAFLGGLFVAALPATALDKITLGYTAVNGNVPDWIAKDQGFFAKHGLDVELTLMRGGNVIVPSLVSNSMQVGTVGASTLIQAADGGIDLVALTNLSLFAPGTKDSGVVVRNGANINTPADLKGKRIGTSTIGGISEIAFEHWLVLKGVNPKEITIVEIAYAEMPNVLKAGNLDAVLIPDPFMSAIAADGSGKILSYFYGELGTSVPALVNASTRAWAESHKQEVAAIRAATEEAVAFAEANPEKTKEIITKTLNLKPEVTATMLLAQMTAKIKTADLQWWLDAMNEQDRLRTKLTAARLIAP
jgi:NitT/TauT family transport system substrate-binding protein